MTDYLDTYPRYRVRPFDAIGIREFWDYNEAWAYFQTVLSEGRKANLITDASY